MFNILVVKLLCLDHWFPLLVFPSWELCALVLYEFVCASWGSPATFLMCLAVTLDLTIFLASWWTLLARNLSRPTHPWLVIFDTNSLSLIKNQTISLCNILAVSGGYFARLTWACTALYHSLTLLLPCQKLVRRSIGALTSFDWLLWNSSGRSQFLLRKAPWHILVHPKVPTPSYYFLAFLLLWECCKLTFQHYIYIYNTSTHLYVIYYFYLDMCITSLFICNV